MRFLMILLASLLFSATTAQANMFKYLLCDDLEQLTQSLENIDSVEQVLSSDESVLVTGCRYSNMSTYQYLVYSDFWYHSDASIAIALNRNEPVTLTPQNLIFIVDRVKLLVNGTVVNSYRVSNVLQMDEFEEPAKFVVRDCQLVPGKDGCLTYRATLYTQYDFDAESG